MTTEHDDTFDIDMSGSEPNRVTALDPKALSVAMATPDQDVVLPGRQHPGSVVSNLVALKIGENFTRSVPVERDMTMLDVEDNLNDWKNTLRQSINNSIRHARKFDGRQFAMETALTITTKGRAYVQLIVTRIS